SRSARLFVDLFLSHYTCTPVVYSLSLHDALPICPLRIHRGLEARAGHELRDLHGGDLHGLARARIEAGARRPLCLAEGAEAHETCRVALLDRGDDGREDGVENARRAGLREVVLGSQLFDEFDAIHGLVAPSWGL